MVILFPCTYGNLKVVDDDYKIEKEIADKYGLKSVLFNYDEYVFENKPLKLNISIPEPCDCIYRGWMFKSKLYGKFYSDLNKLNLKLVNNKESYKNAHEFIYSYKILRNYTSEIMTFGLDEKINWKEVKSKFDRFKMKDNVKSIKGFNFPFYFDSTYSCVELDRYLNRFKELRGDLLEGGIILKKYASLKHDSNNNYNEFRCWFYDGKLIHYYRDSDGKDGDLRPLDVNWVKKLPKLKSKFYTIDVGELRNGGWIVVETGDGQVSGYRNSDKESSKASLAAFYKKLRD